MQCNVHRFQDKKRIYANQKLKAMHTVLQALKKEHIHILKITI